MLINYLKRLTCTISSKCKIEIFNRSKSIFSIVVILVLLVLSSGSAKGQDPNFSQFYYNLLYYNPSYAGLQSGLNVRMNYRKAWPKMDQGYSSYNLSIESEEASLYGGIGLMAFSGNDASIMSHSGFNLSYAYRLVIVPRQFVVQMGMSAGVMQKKIDWNSLTFSDQIDPIYGDIYQTAFSYPEGDKVIYPDFGTGIVGRFNIGNTFQRTPLFTGTVGVAFHHVTQPVESFMGFNSKLPMKTVVHADAIVPLNRRGKNDVKIAPAVIFEKQDHFQTFTAGFNALKSPLYVGLWWRNQSFLLNGGNMESLIVMVGLNTTFSNNTGLKIGYSYDMTLSGLRSATAGSHEISLCIEFDDTRIFNPRQRSMKYRAKSNNVCFEHF